MIVIHKPVVVNSGEKSRLVADVDIDGSIHPLWLEVEKRFGKYLCFERGDAFILGLLLFAIRRGHDIRSEAPMTRRLFEQLTEQFLPAQYKVNRCANKRENMVSGGGYCTHIECELADEIDHPTDGVAVGSGVSCGVDSLHVFASHANITHGCIWNAHGVVAGETEDQRAMSWRQLRERAEGFCSEVGCDLIVGDTNYDRRCVEGLLWDGMLTYGNLFCIFALQKLWSIYYVASGYGIEDFSLKQGVYADPAHYELMLLPMLALKYFTVRLDGGALNRVEKVADLGGYHLAAKYLNVCHEITEDGLNCTSGCAKCMRTVLELEMTGVLEKFRGVFDIQYVRSHWDEYLAEYYRGRLHKNAYCVELKPYMAAMSISIPVRIRAWIIVVRKAFRKLLRVGRVDCGKFRARG